MTEFSQELADRILDLMAEGNDLTTICKMENMPSQRTVRRWVHLHTEFGEAYGKARVMLADFYLDQAIAIADDAKDDWLTDDKGRMRVDNEAVARSRLRVDTRIRLAEKLAPNKYGVKQQLEHSGPGGKPIEVVSDLHRVRALQVLLAARDGPLQLAHTHLDASEQWEQEAQEAGVEPSPVVADPRTEMQGRTILEKILRR
jgi:hypothetical protein